MGLIDIVGGLFLTKFFYDIQRPKPIEKSAKFKAYDREYHRMLTNMNLWDGIEYQVNEHLKSYNMEKCNWYKAGIYWNGDKNKYFQIDKITLQINKDYYASNLSMEEFAKQYFKNLKMQHKSDDPFWIAALTESYRNITLYDDNGNPHYFCHWNMD